MLELFILTGMAFWAGWKISQAWHLFTFKQILQDLKISNTMLAQLAKKQGIELAQEDKEDENANLPILEVRVEKTDLGLFAYRRDNSLYLARGKDREELMANMVNNLTNVRVIVHNEDGAEHINP